MTMNAEHDPSKNSTPPVHRTARQIFMDHIRKAREKYDLAVEIQNTYLNNPARYGGENGALIACSEDHHWRKAVGDEQFAERLANMYANVVVVNTLERLLQEQQNTNQLLAHLIQASGYGPTDVPHRHAADAAENYLQALRDSRRGY